MLINYALYQVGWFACIFGAAWSQPWTGLLVALALGGAHLVLAVERMVELRLVVLATAVGLVVEMIQIATGTYRVTSGTVIEGLPPPWLLAMWAQFATTFRFSLRQVITRPVSATLFGALGGPIAFLAGDRLGALTLLPPASTGLLRIAITWAVALLIFSTVVRRLAPLEGEARYRSVGRGSETRMPR